MKRGKVKFLVRAHNEERGIEEVDTHRIYGKPEGQINKVVYNLLQVCEI